MNNARENKIIRTSVFGILVNLALVTGKGLVGFLANSVSVIMDAVNNLSDALSSVITIIGTKLSTKKPDKKHPYGHGRVEYITAIIIAAVILFAGTSSLYQSITKVIAPDETDFKFYSYIIISVAVVTKLVFGTYVKRVGKKLNSTSLIATGTDAFFDALLSLGTLVGAVLVMITGILLFDGVIGIIISLFILKSGISILTETFSSIIGARVDDGLTDRLKKEINSFDNVLGVYDLTLHNYGPTKFIGTAHVEVPDDLTAKEIHKLSRLISASVYTKFGIILTIGVYASGNTNPLQPAIKSDLEEVLKSFPEVKQMHAFYIDEDLKAVSFDLIVDFSADAENTRSAIIQKISSIHPDYRYFVVLDADYSD